MKYHLGIGALLLAVLSGCGTYIPEIREPWDTEHYPTISSNGVLEGKVKEKVYCAIYKAVKAQSSLPVGWAVQNTIDLQVDQTGAVNPGLSYVLPFNSAENFAVGLGATLSSQSTREDKFGSYWDLDRLKAQSTHECDRDDLIEGSSPLITNELDLTTWLRDAIENDVTNPSSPIAKDNIFNQDSFTYHIKFIVITTGTANPTFKLVRWTSSNTSPLASINRTRTHDILLTFGPKYKPKGPNIPLLQHSASEYGLSIGNAINRNIASPSITFPTP